MISQTDGTDLYTMNYMYMYINSQLILSGLLDRIFFVTSKPPPSTF